MHQVGIRLLYLRRINCEKSLVGMCALCGLIIPPWLNMRFTGDLDVGTLVVKKILMGTSTSHPSTSTSTSKYKKLSYCWETVRRESMPRIAEMDVEMTT